MLYDEEIEIKGLIESSFLDWDGKIVSTIYLPKCNLHCPFCHNWKLIEQPEDFKTISRSKLLRHLRANHDFIDGVCITGGEPTIYSKLPELIDFIRDLGLKIKLDTNGTNPEMLAELINEKKIEYIAMDIKGPVDERYNKLSGCKVDLDDIQESIRIIMSSGIDYEFRTTVVPTLIAEQDINDILEYIPDAKKIVFQQFVPDHTRAESLRSVKPYSKETMEGFCNLAQDKNRNVTIRGLK